MTACFSTITVDDWLSAVASNSDAKNPSLHGQKKRAGSVDPVVATWFCCDAEIRQECPGEVEATMNTMLEHASAATSENKGTK